MPPKLRREIEKLSPAQQIKLANQIYDRFEGDPRAFPLTDKEEDDLDLTLEQKHELDRRLEDHYKHPRAGLTWEQVEQKMKHKK